MAKLSPVFNDAQFINKIPASDAKLFTYAAGSSTKLTAYKDEDSASPHSNPIILNARGEPDNPIWLTEGQTYKFILAPSDDADPPTSAIRTIDNVTGVNDTGTTTSQWVASGVTPTYVSATQFTVPGDQTEEFKANRRIKATVTAGTVYGYISVSAYTSLTTVTVVLDSGSLDSGLSAVSLGLITPDNTSLRVVADMLADNSVATASLQDGSVRGTKMTAKLQDIDASVASNALTITINPTTLDFRSTTLTDGTPTTVNLASAATVVVPDTATLGTVNNQSARLAVLAINNAGTIEAAVVNLAGGNQLDETNLINTTTIGTGADSANVIYSTTGRTSVAYRVVGFIDITEATAGTWATAPTLVQGNGGEALVALSSIGYGQTWQNVTASRAIATTYYNTTGKPIQIHVAVSSNAAAYPVLTITQNGASVILIGSYNNSTGVPGAITAIIPAGAAYAVGMNTGSASIVANGWLELR